MHQLERLTQAYPQIPWRGQLQLVGLFLVLVVILALVAGFYLSVSANSAAIGRDIQGMQNQIRLLEQENETLKAKLAELSSSRVLEERSDQLGFEPIQTDEVMYVYVPGYAGRQPVSLAPTYEEPVISAPVMPNEYTESLFEWLYQHVSPYVLPLFEVKQ